MEWFVYQVETNLNFMKPNLIVETQQLDSILLVYILISATQTNRVQARVFLLDGFESYKN